MESDKPLLVSQRERNIKLPDGSSLTDPSDIANHLNSHVAGVGQKMAACVNDNTPLCNRPGETQPGEILANLGPGQFWKKKTGQILMNLIKNYTSLATWWNFEKLLGEQMINKHFKIRIF